MISTLPDERPLPFPPAPWRLRLYLHLRLRWYFPFLGAGISIGAVSRDFGFVRMRLRRRIWNKNYLGSHFGGSLYAMCDPVYMLMLIYHLGPEYLVIDHGAKIEFLKTTKETVFADFRLSPERVASIQKKLQNERKIIESFSIEVRSSRDLIARVEKTVYIRRAGRLKRRRWV